MTLSVIVYPGGEEGGHAFLKYLLYRAQIPLVLVGRVVLFDRVAVVRLAHPLGFVVAVRSVFFLPLSVAVHVAACLAVGLPVPFAVSCRPSFLLLQSLPF